MFPQNDQFLTPQAMEFLEQCKDALPGGVECGACRLVNTYAPETTEWNRLKDGSYLFSQSVRCTKCGHTEIFSWVQEFEDGVK